MSKIKFLFEKNILQMKFEANESIENLIKKYTKILSINSEDLFFLYKGKNIFKCEDILKKLQKKIALMSVIKLNKSKTSKDIENITCPKCKNLSFLKINEYDITIKNCPHKHIFNYFSINEFIESQTPDESSLKCDLCHNYKRLYNDNFYICQCKKYICPLCLPDHIDISAHKAFYFNKRYSFCTTHFLNYVSYCSNCCINLCEKCEKAHIKHKNKILLYKKEKLNSKKINELENEIKENIESINKYKEEINKLNELFGEFIMEKNKDLENMNKLYETLINILNNLSNYENIKNILNLKIDNINKNTNEFLSENLKNKMKYLLKIFIIYINESVLIYDIHKNDTKIRLFGKEFVKNNKNNYFLIIDNKKINLCENYTINNEYNIDTLKVKLIEKSKVTNLSYMFSYCSNLSSISDVSKWDTNKIKDMNSMFSDCSTLLALPDISKWNTSNVTDMSFMFNNCKSLLSLPDISNWNTDNVTDMSYMFANCSKIKSLPDISKWNTEKVKYMTFIFSECSSLEELPDISVWNTSNIRDISYMFSKCVILKTLPDISKWVVNNVDNMSYMFENCSSLTLLPDISKWDVGVGKKAKNVDLSFMFIGCNKSLFIPKKFIIN